MLNFVQDVQEWGREKLKLKKFGGWRPRTYDSNLFMCLPINTRGRGVGCGRQG